MNMCGGLCLAPFHLRLVVCPKPPGGSCCHLTGSLAVFDPTLGTSVYILPVPLDGLGVGAHKS